MHHLELDIILCCMIRPIFTWNEDCYLIENVSIIWIINTTKSINLFKTLSKKEILFKCSSACTFFQILFHYVVFILKFSVLLQILTVINKQLEHETQQTKICISLQVLSAWIIFITRKCSNLSASIGLQRRYPTEPNAVLKPETETDTYVCHAAVISMSLMCSLPKKSSTTKIRYCTFYIQSHLLVPTYKVSARVSIFFWFIALKQTI